MDGSTSGAPARRRIEVVGAVIERDGLVLCVRRPPGGETGGLWEFPGGKVEVGEDPREALAREISEELGCVVEVGAEVVTTTREYAAATIVLTTYRCMIRDGEPVLREHDAARWLAPSELGALAWAPADLEAVAILRG